MKYRNNIFYLAFRIAVLGTVLMSFIASCTPQKRLDRLIRKHPELKHTDTVKTSVTITLPGVNHDTLIPINQNLDSILSSVLLSYKGHIIDSMSSIKIEKQIVKQINNNGVLKDTVKFYLDDSTSIKLFQAGSFIHHTISRPPKKITKPVAVAYANVHDNPIQKEKHWPWMLMGAFLLLILQCAAFILVRYFRH